MRRNVALISCVVGVVVLLAGGILYDYISRSTSAPYSFPVIPTPDASSPVTTAAAEPAQPLPTGGITAKTASSITVASDNGTVTYKVTASTLVYSVTKAGQTGRTFADLSLSDGVSVIPEPSDPTTASMIIVLPPVPPNPQGTPVIGSVTEKTSGSLTLKTDSGSQTILINSATQIYSTVTQGKPGKTFAEVQKGAYVTAWVADTTATSQTALMLQI